MAGRPGSGLRRVLLPLKFATNDSPVLEKSWADRIGSDLYLNLERDLYRKLGEEEH